MPAKGKARTSKTVEPSTPTPTPEPTTEHVASATVDVVEPTQSLSDDFNELVTTLATLKTTVSSLSSRMRSLQKRVDREIKSAQKKKTKRGPLSADGKPRKPSGFVKPTDITPELAKFLGKDKGVMMARTEVTREINKYIREHKLQDPSNGRIIKPDASLRKLLNVKAKDELTYFNLQKYMSPHFVKAVPVVSA
jgi:chromatin remodeling complex protein RSC6